MNPRSKKYYQKRKEDKGQHKGSVTDAGYNEQNEITTRQSPKKNLAPPKSKDDSSEASLQS